MKQIQNKENNNPNEQNANTIAFNLINEHKKQCMYDNTMMGSEEIDEIIMKLNIDNRCHLYCSDTLYIIQKNQHHIERIKNKIHKHDYITFTLCEHKHYMLGIILQKKYKCIIFDSYLDEGKSSFELTCKQMMNSLFNLDFEIIVPLLAQQNDGTSCGKFCIYYYLIINYGFDLNYLQFQLLDVKKLSIFFRSNYVPENKNLLNENNRRIIMKHKSKRNTTSEIITIDDSEEESEEINNKMNEIISNDIEMKPTTNNTKNEIQKQLEMICCVANNNKEESTEDLEKKEVRKREFSEIKNRRMSVRSLALQNMKKNHEEEKEQVMKSIQQPNKTYIEGLIEKVKVQKESKEKPKSITLNINKNKNEMKMEEETKKKEIDLPLTGTILKNKSSVINVEYVVEEQPELMKHNELNLEPVRKPLLKKEQIGEGSLQDRLLKMFEYYIPQSFVEKIRYFTNIKGSLKQYHYNLSHEKCFEWKTLETPNIYSFFVSMAILGVTRQTKINKNKSFDGPNKIEDLVRILSRKHFKKIASNIEFYDTTKSNSPSIKLFLQQIRWAESAIGIEPINLDDLDEKFNALLNHSSPSNESDEFFECCADLIDTVLEIANENDEDVDEENDEEIYLDEKINEKEEYLFGLDQQAVDYRNSSGKYTLDISAESNAIYKNGVPKKYQHIEWVVNHFNNKFINNPFITISSEICVDESLNRYLGRSGMTVAMVRKPAKRGFKHFPLCDSVSGVIWNDILYMGKDDDCSHVGLNELITIELLKPFRNLKDTTVYCDRGFTSFNLVEYLLKSGFETIGTLNERSICVPNELSDYKNSDEIISMKSNNIRLFQFKDKSKNVMMLSSSSRDFKAINIEDKKKEKLRLRKEKMKEKLKSFEEKVAKKVEKQTSKNISFFPFTEYETTPRKSIETMKKRRNSSVGIETENVNENEAKLHELGKEIESLLNIQNENFIGVKPSHVFLYNRFMGGVDSLDRDICSFNTQLITRNSRFALFCNYYNYCLHNICSIGKIIFDEEYKNDENKRKKENLPSRMSSVDLIELLVESIVEKYINPSNHKIVDIVYAKTFGDCVGKGDCSICSEYFNVKQRNGESDHRTTINCCSCKMNCCKQHCITQHKCYKCLGLRTGEQMNKFNEQINEMKKEKKKK